MLTTKQETFCRAVASGKSYIDSYLSAYDWNGSDNGAYTEAIKLANREDIQERIKALQKPLEIKAQQEALTARQQQIDFIQSRIEICKAKDDEQSLIRWSEQLNKIYNLYKDTEEEHKPETTVSELDIHTLKKLSGTA